MKLLFSQHINKLTESNKKRIIRNIAGIQQHLCRITQRRENELDRAKTFFDLLNKDPDQLLGLCLISINHVSQSNPSLF